MPEPSINTHGARVPFGKYKGERVTRIPVGYLRWAVEQDANSEIVTDSGSFPFAAVARAEMERRGVRLEDIEVSKHAIDRLSIRYWRIFQNRPDREEGLYAWAQRLAKEAWDERRQPTLEEALENNLQLAYLGIVWCIDTSLAIPVVKTVK